MCRYAGLGYPLLLCLGKSLVVILDYIRTVGPLRTGALLPDNGPGPVPRLGKVREHHVFREKQALRPNNRGFRTSRGSPDPRGVPDPHRGPGPLNRNRTPHRGKESAPLSGGVRSRHVCISTDTYTRSLGLHTKPHPPLHSLW